MRIELISAEHADAVQRLASDPRVTSMTTLPEPYPEGGAAELGYWVGVPFWGRGYASAACARVLEFAFGKLRLEKVHAYPLEENTASRHVLEKLGFRLEALVPNEDPKWSAERRLACYRITRGGMRRTAAHGAPLDLFR